MLAGYDQFQPPYEDSRSFKPPHTFKSGAVYHGQWIGNKRDGYGSQEWPDGARYDGNNSFIFLKNKRLLEGQQSPGIGKISARRPRRLRGLVGVRQGKWKRRVYPQERSKV